MTEEYNYRISNDKVIELPRGFADKRALSCESDIDYPALIFEMYNGFALNQVIFDENGVPLHSKFLQVNSAFEEITGLKESEIFGKTTEEVFPGTEKFWVDLCGQVAVTGNPIQFKNISRLFDKYFEIIAYSPKKDQVATVFLDITQRGKIERALTESKNNFRAIAENSNDGILIASTNGNYVYANGRASEITGYSNKLLLNMSLRDLVHRKELKRVTQIFNNRFAGISVPDNYETIIINRNGKEIPIDVTGSRLLWKSKTAAMIVIRDITQRKQFEKALSKIHDQLELRVQERTAELRETAKKLEEKQKDLMLHKADLERANKELVQTNTALTVLARNIDKKKDELESKIAKSVGSRIAPLIEEIKNDKIPDKSRAKLDILAEYLNHLTPKVAKGHEIIVSLSSMETRIAAMIGNGYSSDQIARLLFISPHTVKTHRRNIRRKLKINNSKINLASYLKLKLGKISAES